MRLAGAEVMQRHRLLVAGEKKPRNHEETLSITVNSHGKTAADWAQVFLPNRSDSTPSTLLLGWSQNGQEWGVGGGGGNGCGR